ncbi:TRAP transporter substrate-binding protein DctP [Limnobacter litoralis]|uniref:C4-dicarboxylate ABC transporter n=1 Tax=Limnobacter litoralis TaxID=481366 RepID=A0ABQ5YVV3_9BURK|nr:TRAP transporter substrate-binding protein DctP [Limnobacter litoralis]GLR27525.1 C4-dicarboxylate ABC transporter [Limnobacter litoralis]
MRVKFKPMLAGVALALMSVGPFQAANAAPTVIKVSHQFPGGTLDEGDFRDRLVRHFAAEVEKRTNGEVKFEIYPGSSLMKTKAQFSAMQRGSLDMTIYPLAYEGGRIPEVNITLMPAMITSYEQGQRWKNAPIGKALSKTLEDNGVKIITWVWQAGGIASKSPIVQPSDVKGVKIRGAGKTMDLMLKAAGGSITNIPSNEVYNALQTGVLDAGVTSSTSIISFRLEEVSDYLTSARKNTFWYMFEPLLMAKSTFDRLTPAQQKIVMDVGASLEKFGIDEAKKDDTKVAEIYEKAGKKVLDMDDTNFAKFRALSKQSAWKEFADQVKDGQHWIDMAEAVK